MCYEGLLARAQQLTATLFLRRLLEFWSGGPTACITSTAKYFQLTGFRELFWGCDSGLFLTTANEKA